MVLSTITQADNSFDRRNATAKGPLVFTLLLLSAMLNLAIYLAYIQGSFGDNDSVSTTREPRSGCGMAGHTSTT
jgi:hypothetical protein